MTAVAPELPERRRRLAAFRLPPMPDGRRDPLDQAPIPGRELSAALDWLDLVGLCACWTAPRRHREVA